MYDNNYDYHEKCWATNNNNDYRAKSTQNY